jgi:hypothetical protein
MIQNHLSPLLSLFTQVAQFQVSTSGSLLMSRVAHFLVDIRIKDRPSCRTAAPSEYGNTYP